MMRIRQSRIMSSRRRLMRLMYSGWVGSKYIDLNLLMARRQMWW